MKALEINRDNNSEININKYYKNKLINSRKIKKPEKRERKR